MKGISHLKTMSLLVIISMPCIPAEIYPIIDHIYETTSSITALKKQELFLNAENDTLTLVIDAENDEQPISPYIFGEFLEHQGRCIYGGIWAEMIRDRKFFYPIDTFLYIDPNHKSPWRAIPIGTYAEMDSLHVFVGEHSPRIDLDSQSILGIMQDSIALVQGKNYTGHIVLSGIGTIVVKVSLVWGPGPEQRQTIEVSQLFEQYEPTPLFFASPVNTGLGSLEINR